MKKFRTFVQRKKDTSMENLKSSLEYMQTFMQVNFWPRFDETIFTILNFISD